MAFIIIIRIIRVPFYLAVTEIAPIRAKRKAVHLFVVTVVAGFKVYGKQIAFLIFKCQVWIEVLCRGKFQNKPVALGKGSQFWDEYNFYNLRYHLRIIGYSINVLIHIYKALYYPIIVWGLK